MLLGGAPRFGAGALRFGAGATPRIPKRSLVSKTKFSHGSVLKAVALRSGVHEQGFAPNRGALLIQDIGRRVRRGIIFTD